MSTTGMRKLSHALKALFFGVATSLAATPALAVDVTLTPAAIQFNNPIGIDWYEPLSQLILSVNFPDGTPHNLDLVDPSIPPPNATQYSSLSGLTNELKIATVRATACQGGFGVGDAFTGNGQPGEIVRLSPGGAIAGNPWVTLPTTDTLRGSFFQDRFCAAGGDLIVVTAHEQPEASLGEIWRVTSSGTPTLLLTTGTHLEGVTTVPNNAAVHGPAAGRILAGAEDLIVAGQYGPAGRIYAVNPANGNDWFTIGAGAGPTCVSPYTIAQSGCNFPTAEIHPEDLDVIRGNAEFYGVNYNSFPNGRVLKASAADFTLRCGQVLVTREFPAAGTSGLSALRWNAGTSSFIVDALSSNLDGTADAVQQWEHVTFTSGTDCSTTLSVAKTPDNGTFNVGDTVSWTIAVQNTGVVDAGNVVLDDTLPSAGGLTWSVFSTTQGSCAVTSGVLHCSLGALAPNAIATVIVHSSNIGGAPAAACTGQKINNTATASASNALPASDDGDTTCTPPAQLRVVKTPDNGTFAQGAQVSFTIVVSNPAAAGGSAANNVQLSDQLPGSGGLIWSNVSVDPAAGTSCTIVSNLLNCSLGSIAAGESKTVTVSSGLITPNSACQSQSNPVARATADGGLSAQDSGSLTCTPPVTLQTVTQGGWGAPAHGQNPGTILNAYFAGPHSNVVIGSLACASGKTLTFTTANAIRGFLPAGGTPGVLAATVTNPTSSAAGVFAGQVLALQLNVTLSNAGKLPGGLGNYVLTTGAAAGKTVSQVLADANKALGGCGLPSYVTNISQLNDIVTSINEKFD